MSLREDLETRNWATFSSYEKTVWLYLFILNQDVQEVEEGKFVLNDGTEIKTGPTSNLIARCEQHVIKDSEIESLYVKNVTREVSNITYKGILPEDVKKSETAETYYRNMIFLDADTKAKCMFWARRNANL